MRTKATRRTLQRGSYSFHWTDLQRRCLSEMLGTYLLVLFGPGSVVTASVMGLSPAETLFFVAAVFGITVAFVILGLGRFSGAHINPAISVGSAIAGLLERELVLPYMAFQVAGGVLAGFSLSILFGVAGSRTNLGSTSLAVGISPIEGVLLEVVGTFFLTTSALLAGSLLKSKLGQAFLVGGTLFILILVIGPSTGASFNPARSLGPSLFSGYLSAQIVYYIGPVLGAILAGLVFRRLRKRYVKEISFQRPDSLRVR